MTSITKQEFQNKTLALAFSELLSFLRKLTDIELAQEGDIRVEFRLAKAKGHSVCLKDNVLVFDAPDEIQILYAVYDFAQSILGFCFYEPGKDTLSKNNRQLSEGVLVESPAPLLSVRGLIQEFPFSDKNYCLADWMCKNRLNYLLTHMKYYDQMSPELKEYYAVRGITVESGHHNFNYWIPAEKYYRDHPEYFAIIDGKRIVPSTDKGYLAGGQLCATNPALRRQIALNMIDYCKRHPEVKVISLMPNDGFGWCECPQCSKFYDKQKKGKPQFIAEHVYLAQDLYHDMVADISAQIKKAMPDVTLTLAAYINYVEPAESFRLYENLAVHFAPYWRCIRHEIADERCPVNSGYIAALKKWQSAKKGGKIYIYEYLMGINLYISLPMIHYESVFNEVDYYSRNGVDGFLTQFHQTHWVAYGLNYYFMAKALYGQDKSCIAKTMQALFGKDTGRVREFYDTVRKLTDSVGHCHIPYPRSLLSRTDIQQYTAINRMAQQLASAQPDNELLQKLVIWTEYLVRFKTLFDDYHSGKNVRGDIEGFLNWAQLYADDGIFVFPMVKLLFAKWLERIDKKEPWYHFNLDWEDAYIRRHDLLWR